MRFTSMALSAIAALALAGCAADPPRSATVQPAAAPAAGDPAEIVCRDQEQTGTRFKKQKCSERSQIDEETRQSRDTLPEVLRKGGNTSDAAATLARTDFYMEQRLWQLKGTAAPGTL